jgi:hypothetical protein
MDPEKYYFQIDYKGAVTTSTGEFREGYLRKRASENAREADHRKNIR